MIDWKSFSVIAYDIKGLRDFQGKYGNSDCQIFFTPF